jgi:hypothetical protein
MRECGSLGAWSWFTLHTPDCRRPGARQKGRIVIGTLLACCEFFEARKAVSVPALGRSSITVEKLDLLREPRARNLGQLVNDNT